MKCIRTCNNGKRTIIDMHAFFLLYFTLLTLAYVNWWETKFGFLVIQERGREQEWEREKK